MNDLPNYRATTDAPSIDDIPKFPIFHDVETCIYRSFVVRS